MGSLSDSGAHAAVLPVVLLHNASMLQMLLKHLLHLVCCYGGHDACLMHHMFFIEICFFFLRHIQLLGTMSAALE